MFTGEGTKDATWPENEENVQIFPSARFHYAILYMIIQRSAFCASKLNALRHGDTHNSAGIDELWTLQFTSDVMIFLLSVVDCLKGRLGIVFFMGAFFKYR